MILNLNISYGFKRETFFKKQQIQNTKNLVSMTRMCMITVNFTFLSYGQR